MPKPHFTLSFSGKCFAALSKKQGKMIKILPVPVIPFVFSDKNILKSSQHEKQHGGQYQMVFRAVSTKVPADEIHF